MPIGWHNLASTNSKSYDDLDVNTNNKLSICRADGDDGGDEEEQKQHTRRMIT
jgi:hypothetical protein